MRIGFVTPWLHGVRGNKIVLSYANELARTGHDTELLAHTVRPTFRAEIERLLGRARLSYVKESDRPYVGHADEIAWQLAGGRDRALADLITNSHQRSPFDALVLAANEGHGVGRLLRARLQGSGPLLGWSVMELIDHSFLLRYERDLPALRSLASPLYPIIHSRWARSLAAYDFLMANSEWTGDLLDYLYGAQIRHIFMSLAPSTFERPSPTGADTSPPYIAVPTASLGPHEQRLLTEVASSGVPLVGYGPRPARGIQHLGYLTEDRMREVLAGAAATLFLFDYEALGLIPFESLALGTPVITLPKHGVRRQWLQHPFVTFARSPEEFVEAVRRSLEHPPTPEARQRAADSIRPFAAANTAQEFVHFLERERLRAGRKP